MQSLHEIDPEEIRDISGKWVQQCSRLTELERELSVLEFPTLIENRPIEIEFKVGGKLWQVLSYMTETTQHVDKLYKNPVQFGLNRYNNLLPYQFSMVRLGEEMPVDDPSAYINANNIQTYVKGRIAIATQGPLPNTVDSFWRMVLERNIKNVFMLCNFEEHGQPRCYRYWPTKGTQQIVSLSEKPLFSVKMLQESNELEKVSHRTLEVTELTTGNKRLLNHHKVDYQVIQWKGWRDNQAVSKQDYTQLGLLLEIAKSCLHRGQDILVHCSAGVGRTGTFIALLNITLQLDFYLQCVKQQTMTPQNLRISVFRTVRQLRQQRWGMVFVKQQYRMIYEYLANYIQSRFH